MAKILVTGGAGFIGSHIVDSLLRDGHEVHVMDNLSSGNLENVSLSARFHEGDIRSDSAVEILRGISPDIIVHCAAQISVRTSMEDPKLDTDINIAGLINILQAFPGGVLPYFVMISTGGAIYGDQDVYPAPEDHPIRPDSVYGLAKRVSELYLDLWQRKFGLKFCSLRLANVYGPRQNPHGEAGVVAIFTERLLAYQQVTINGSGNQTRDFVYVKDVASAVKNVCVVQPNGIFNIGTGVETSVNMLYNMIKESLHSELEPKYGAAKLGEQMRSSIDATAAHKSFDWTPKVKLNEGIKETTNWFFEASKKKN
jgi:UDP-glucose 4-epimerase